MKNIGIAFDIDGVICHGETVLSPAIRAIKKVEAERAKAEQLSKILGMHISSDQVVLSHTPMAPLAAEYSNDDSPAVLILGRDGCKDAALAYGFKHPILSDEILATCNDIFPLRTPDPKYKPVDNIDRKIGAILAFHDSEDWGRDIQIICDLMRTGGDLRAVIEHGPHHSHPPKIYDQLPIYISCGDYVWQNKLPLTRLTQGYFCRALEGVYHHLSGGKHLKFTMFGKPEKSTYDFAQSAIDKHARVLYGEEVGNAERRYFGVGDNLQSDIEGANRNGWVSVLVKTGVYKTGAHEADILVDTVEHAVDAILEYK
ncbi:hypothetical protein HDU98_003102 [Podochytrium sp. JEL0797]|nr:hypothetical protein HDU98_003102 [Podochytrium sp. JEL0797]